MSTRLIATAALTASTLLLCSCGFVTAPLSYGGAYAGKGTIKTADKGIEYGKSAANVVVDTAIYVGDVAVDVIQSESEPDLDPDAPARRGSLRRR